MASITPKIPSDDHSNRNPGVTHISIVEWGLSTYCDTECHSANKITMKNCNMQKVILEKKWEIRSGIAWCQIWELYTHVCFYTHTWSQCTYLWPSYENSQGRDRKPGDLYIFPNWQVVPKSGRFCCTWSLFTGWLGTSALVVYHWHAHPCIFAASWAQRTADLSGTESRQYTEDCQSLTKPGTQNTRGGSTPAVPFSSGTVFII